MPHQLPSFFLCAFPRTTCCSECLRNPSGCFMHNQDKYSEILHGAHIEFMCSAWIPEKKTATFVLYNIVWLLQQRRRVFTARYERSIYILQTCFIFNGLRIYLVLDFKLSPCFESCMYSFGYFSGVWLLYADVSEHSICSIFIGWI